MMQVSATGAERPSQPIPEHVAHANVPGMHGPEKARLHLDNARRILARARPDSVA